MTGPGGRVGPDLEHVIARILTIGTRLSVALLAIGVGLMVAAGVSPLSGGPAFDPARLGADLAALRPEGVLWLALIAVVLTPASRVTASLIGYAGQGDRRMTLVAALILVVIGASVVLARVEGG